MNVVKLKTKPTKFECSACGAPAGCDCGAKLIPVGERAAKAVAMNPEKSDRALAKEAGTTHPTIAKARRDAGGKHFPPESSGAANAAPERHVGRDGKSYPAKKKRKPKIVIDNTTMPTEQEAHESEQEHTYKIAVTALAFMTDATRQKFFAYIRRKYGYGK